ncbi:MAG: hypothetical protein M1823_000006 [Watsoniomyces obsoletus]|nr:MAG: hypothetical protein M1823_000006 [Watsoniomyces obsoletus]
MWISTIPAIFVGILAFVSTAQAQMDLSYTMLMMELCPAERSAKCMQITNAGLYSVISFERKTFTPKTYRWKKDPVRYDENWKPFANGCCALFCAGDRPASGRICDPSREVKIIISMPDAVSIECDKAPSCKENHRKPKVNRVPR